MFTVPIELFAHLPGCDPVSSIDLETPLLERRHRLGIVNAKRPPNGVGERRQLWFGHAMHRRQGIVVIRQCAVQRRMLVDADAEPWWSG